MKTGVEEEWCWRLDKAARSESGPPDWRVETVVSKSFPPTLSFIRSDEIPSSMFVIVDCSVSAILRRVESWLTKLVSSYGCFWRIILLQIPLFVFLTWLQHSSEPRIFFFF
ncbi:hypothetical protein HanIR_Chr10g0463731 [Helianthus annuus]|nr:hypothetical protein HanIR_Chr10g0463731 [Helianthus annuus]